MFVVRRYPEGEVISLLAVQQAQLLTKNLSGPWFRSCQPSTCSDPAQCPISNTFQLRDTLLEFRPGLVGPDPPADALWQCLQLAKPLRQSLFVGLKDSSHLLS
jgi:hypothetical protein